MSNGGFKNICRRVSSFLVLFLLLSLPLAGGGNDYRKQLKKWTREVKSYAFKNLEMKLQWYATYLSVGFREVRDRKLSEMLGWNEQETAHNRSINQKESKMYDDFIVSIYASSSERQRDDLDDGLWRFELVSGTKKTRPISFKRIPVTRLERSLYPYHDRWSNLYLLRFPKTVKNGESFRLRMLGLPAKEELDWN